MDVGEVAMVKAASRFTFGDAGLYDKNDFPSLSPSHLFFPFFLLHCSLNSFCSLLFSFLLLFSLSLSQSPPVVPPGAEVEFEIEVLSAEDAPLPGELSVEERLKIVDAKRERGNRQFQEGNFATAEKMSVCSRCFFPPLHGF